MKCINALLLKNNFTVVHEENKKDKKILFYILAGYKKNLYSKVFGRVDKYFDIDADVCIVSSGLFDPKLDEIAKERGWVYLHSKINNISLTQNAVISYFSKAELIMKMDEDIFVCQGVFSSMLKAYEEAKKKKKVAFVAPLLNVNGFGSVLYLNKLSKTMETEKRFGPLFWSWGKKDTLAEQNAEFVKYIWNAEGNLLPLDEGNAEMGKNGFSYVECPIYFSIGLILFERKLWKSLGYFATHPGMRDLGTDEIRMNGYAKRHHLTRVVVDSCLAGHFSFGPTGKEMTALFNQKPDLF